MAEDWQHGGFGIYVHWPFCTSKCPYCDFNSHVVANLDESRWLRAYLNEIDRYAEEVPDRVLSSIFFGGGTPSLMSPDTVAAIIARIRAHWPARNDLEVTLEANPGSVEAARFKGFSDAGVNRVSVGVQALNAADLKRLGRLHSVAEAMQALDIARNTFRRVSFDLIYARQDQSLADWRAELCHALGFAADHLSLYQLTIEPGTAFGDRHASGKLRGLPSEDLGAELYLATQELCEDAGFSAYEVSNHAQPGAESRHNLIYWNYGDYAGIGPGAHSRLSASGERQAIETHLTPGTWLAAAEAGSGESLRRTLGQQEQAEEYLMMGLRLAQGIDLKRYSDLSGEPLEPAALRHLEAIGMIAPPDTHLRVTPQGRMVLNAVIQELFAG